MSKYIPGIYLYTGYKSPINLLKEGSTLKKSKLHIYRMSENSS